MGEKLILIFLACSCSAANYQFTIIPPSPGQKEIKVNHQIVSPKGISYTLPGVITYNQNSFQVTTTNLKVYKPIKVDIMYAKKPAKTVYIVGSGKVNGQPIHPLPQGTSKQNIAFEIRKTLKDGETLTLEFRLKVVN